LVSVLSLVPFSFSSVAVVIAVLAALLCCSVLHFNLARGAGSLGLVDSPTLSLNVGSVSFGVIPSANGGLAVGSHAVQVDTNVFSGYYLTLSTNSLTDNSLQPQSSAHSLPITAVGDGASTGTLANPTILEHNTWGYALAGGNFSTETAYTGTPPSALGKYASVPVKSSPATIKTTSAATVDDATTVYYGVKVDYNLPPDEYQQTVVYTAVANMDMTTLASPEIESISPSSGPVEGGTAITIVGENFTVNFGGEDYSITTSVRIGGVNGVGGVDCTSVSIFKDTPVVGKDTITCVTPAAVPEGVVGKREVAVATWSGGSPAVNGDEVGEGGFTYVAPPTVTNISPNTGAIAGGTLIVITGTSFTTATAVDICNNNTFTVDSDTQITCSTKPHDAGTVNVTVTNVGGDSPDNGASDDFTYVTPIPTDQWVKVASNNTAAINSITGTNGGSFDDSGQPSFAVDIDDNMLAIVNKAIDDSYPDSWCNYDEKQWCNAVTLDNTTQKYDISGSTGTLTPLAYYKDYAPIGTIIAEEDILGYWTYIPRYAYQVTRYNANNDNTGYRTQTPFNIRFQKMGDTKCAPTEYTDAGRYDQQGYNDDCNKDGTNSRWATHPAFTVGGTELSGFWYGKFESSRSDNYNCYTNTNDGICNSSSNTFIGVPLNTSSLYATIKPNKAPAVYQRVSNQYLSAEYIKTAHNLNAQNTHMSTNNHWGAATYLSTSAYGVGDETCADATCSTNYKKTYNNGYYNSSASSNTNTAMRHQTGCGPVATHSDSYSATCNSYYTEIGQQASTTGNVYGIYDMAGGAHENQMAVYANPTNTPMSGGSANSNSGFTVGGGTTGKCYASTAPNVADCTVTDPLAFPTASGILQQYDVSTFTNTYSTGGGGITQGFFGNNNLCTFPTCGSQALYETKAFQPVTLSYQSWGGDDSTFVCASNPWFSRGGRAMAGSYAGLFYSGSVNGYANWSDGWRAVAGAY
jgi:hypothetical protein